MIFNISQVDALPLTVKELQTATCDDQILGKVLSYVRRKWPHHTSNLIRKLVRN